MFQFGKIRVTAGFFLIPIGMLVLGAADVIPAVAFAAILHEAGHLITLAVCKVRVEEICVTAFGAEIRADLRYVPYGKDILCTLAGPVCNIAAALILGRATSAHLLAGANLLQGMFNLLPLTGLDGARVLQLLLCLVLDPIRAERISRVVELTGAVGLAVITLHLVCLHHAGGFVLLALVGIFVSIWREMRGK